jgi:hypothetical protein
LIDPKTEDDIRLLRTTYTKAKEDGDTETMKNANNDISKILIRVSSETPIVIASGVDFAIKELIKNAIADAGKNDKKNIEMGNLINDGCKTLSCYPLWAALPTIKNYNPEKEKELQKERAENNKTSKKLKQDKKDALTVAEDEKTDSIDPADCAEIVIEKIMEESDDVSKTTFLTYIDNAIRTIKSPSENLTNIRICFRIREFCSEIICELISRIAKLSKIIVKDIAGVRTLNATHIISIFKIILSDGGKEPEEYEKFIDYVEGKLSRYKKHLEEEKIKKVESMPQEKKEKIEKKKTETENNKKLKDFEATKIKMMHFNEKIKNLESEVKVIVEEKLMAETEVINVEEKPVVGEKPVVEEQIVQKTALEKKKEAKKKLLQQP